jgi:hypothetical protein
VRWLADAASPLRGLRSGAGNTIAHAVGREALRDADEDDAAAERVSRHGGSTSPFAEVRSRGTLDYALRTIQQTQNQMASMADTKASIMITVCSIVSTLGITRFDMTTHRWPLLILIFGVLTALLFALLAVLPSLAAPRTRDGRLDVDASSFNLFFFGHFANLPREHFEAMLADVAREDAAIYAMLARDIYGQGIVLARRKYRMLRWSYVVFFAGMFATALSVVAMWLLDVP